MSEEPNDSATTEFAAQVRTILRRDWDPIGLNREAETADEYDAYIDGVVALVEDLLVGRDAIFEHLHDLAARHMGMPESEELTRRCDIAADALLALRESPRMP
jgi:hypothetical protein